MADFQFFKTCCYLTVLFTTLAAPLRAEEIEKGRELALLGDGTEEVASTGRMPRPVSRIAENVSVISSDQIAVLNAHTLLDILQTIPGIQLSEVRTPGSFTGFNVGGFGFQHVLVLLDGIPQNDLLNNFPDAGLIPAQQIDRVEIIKGAASAAWGPALGGVVNVITKSPEQDKIISGTASASYGERSTSDLNGEASGTVNKFGYYLGGGNLHSDGHLPGNGINFNQAWGKLTYDLPSKGSLTLAGNFRDAFRGLEESAENNFRDTDELHYYHLLAVYSQPLKNNLSLDVSAWFRRQDDWTILGAIDQSFPPFISRQVSRQANTKLKWDNGIHSLVGGLEYEHDDIRTDSGNRTLDRSGIYLNGAFSFDALTILPGVRFDHTGLDKDALSYTLGATWHLTEKTVLRGYGAKGYGLPTLAASDSLQNIWTIQGGIESSDIPYLWLKGTLFYNDTWNIEQFNGTTNTLDHKDQNKRGFEIEGRGVPLYGFTLSGGYTYTDARDKETGERLTTGIPEHSLKLALNYDNSLIGLKGVLTGNYVWWHVAAGNFGTPSYKPILWDLHLTQKLLPHRDLSPELFFSVRNLFDGSQYPDALYRNTRRWIEGGVRFRF